MAEQSLKPTRRTALSALAATGVLAVSGRAWVARAQGAKKTFVLVHGTWHGG